MTTIRATCDFCGEVELTISQVRLRRISDIDVWYLFDCPLCGVTQQRPANPRVVEVLLVVGVIEEVEDIRSIEDPITEEEIEAFVRDINLLESSNDDV